MISYVSHCRPRSRYLHRCWCFKTMRSHVMKTVSGCFAVLRQLRSVRRSVSRSVFQSLAVSLVLSRLDHGNATLSWIPQYLLRRLQVMNSAARLVFSSSRYDHITPLLRQLHWRKAAERIDFKLAVLVYKCLHGAAPSYLAEVPQIRQQTSAVNGPRHIVRTCGGHIAV